jgi:hypothetical protein
MVRLAVASVLASRGGSISTESGEKRLLSLSGRDNVYAFLKVIDEYGEMVRERGWHKVI